LQRHDVKHESPSRATHPRPSPIPCLVLTSAGAALMPALLLTAIFVSCGCKPHLRR